MKKQINFTGLGVDESRSFTIPSKDHLQAQIMYKHRVQELENKRIPRKAKHKLQLKRL